MRLAAHRVDTNVEPTGDGAIGDHASLAIVASVILELDHEVCQQDSAEHEGQPSLAPVPIVLGRIELDLHDRLIRQCRMIDKTGVAVG